MEDFSFEVFVARVAVDIEEDHFIWFPTVQQSILTKDTLGRLRVQYSKENKHLVTAWNSDVFDNYDAAFNSAVDMLRGFNSEDMRVCEDNLAKHTAFDLDKIKSRRRIVYKDLNRDDN